MAETKRKRKTKKEKLEEEMNAIEQDAKAYEEKNKIDYDEGLPAFALPPRGYFTRFDQGANVEKLQIMLNHLMKSNINVSGIYDDATIKAVKTFEEKYGGCQNGLYGREEQEAYIKLRGVK